jgi:hypothetical protein
VTLLVVPVFYVQFDRFGALLTRLARRDKPKEDVHGPGNVEANGFHPPQTAARSELEPALPLAKPEPAT